MSTYRLRFILFMLVLCLAPALALAQTDCPAVVETALAAVEQLCQDVGRNQACYGNIEITAVPQPNARDFRFQVVGDIASVADVQSLRLSPMDEANQEWGVALMRLQVNIPDTLPGQNVTFLLFGDVEITSAVSEGSSLNPMQAFILRTGIGDAKCDEAPESGMLVQTPDGVSEVAFNVNGVDVQMGSTVLFQAEQESGLTVSALEGTAYVAAEDGAQFIPAGAWARIGMLPEMRAAGAPELPLSYERQTRLLDALPLHLLPRPVEPAPPLTAGQVEQMHERILSGRVPCGEPSFPSCERLGHFIDNAAETCEGLPEAERPRFCNRVEQFDQQLQGLIEPNRPVATLAAPGTLPPDRNTPSATPNANSTLPPLPPPDRLPLPTLDAAITPLPPRRG